MRPQEEVSARHRKGSSTDVRQEDGRCQCRSCDLGLCGAIIDRERLHKPAALRSSSDGSAAWNTNSLLDMSASCISLKLFWPCRIAAVMSNGPECGSWERDEP